MQLLEATALASKSLSNTYKAKRQNMSFQGLVHLTISKTEDMILIGLVHLRGLLCERAVDPKSFTF